MKNWTGLIVAVFALSACGKSLHLSDKSAGGLKKAMTPVDPGPKINKPGVVSPDSSLQGVSAFDLEDIQRPELGLPLLKSKDSDNLIRTIGEKSAPYQSEKGGGYVKSSNVVFRAIIQIPAKDKITDVTDFSLKLAGLRRYNAKGEDGCSLSKQMLCVIDTKVCSAEKSVAVGSQAPSETKKRSDSENSGAEKSDSEKFDSAPSADSAPASAGADLNPEYSKIETASDVFAKILTETTVDDLQNGESLTAPKDGDLTLDMRELFGLKGKSAQEVVEWIYANSTEFAAGGYRKIRFVMASSVYISGGSLNLSVTTKPDAPQAEAAGKRVHENDDDAIKIESNTPTVTQPSDMDVSVSKRWSDKELLTMKSSGITQIGKKIAAHADSIKSILITGARDRSGSKEVNDRLGLDHAKKVANALIAGLKQGKNTEELIKAITAKSGGVVSETDSKCGKTANCPEDRTVTLSITLKEGLSSNQANELKNTLNSELSGQ